MNAQDKLILYTQCVIAELQLQLPVPIKSAIYKVEHSSRQLLALRGYLRYPRLNRGSMEDNWAWTKEQEDEFISSGKRTEFRAEVAKVKRAFEAKIGGHRLEGVVKVRSLSEQIDLWNRNASVEALGKALNRRALKEMENGGYADQPDVDGLARFKEFLASNKLVGSPSNATPGLSDHGQARAVDFKVYEGAKLVAGPSTKTAKEQWDKPGFTEALRLAARDTKLTGPLKAPYEPWHYSFDDD